MKNIIRLIFILLMSPLLISQQLGKHTYEEWQYIIDTTWGTGASTETKLSVFDQYWNLVDQNWGGFPNLIVNWDSLKNVYRPLVESGVSRGRFYAILSRLTRALNEWHVWTIDQGIDSYMGYDNQDFDQEYPNYPSFVYKPGIPLLNIDPLIFRTSFGAGLTLLPDSTALVYNVMPNHPLDLQPGDIILGYDGIPWRELIKQLLEAELPIIGNRLGSSPLAEHHVLMLSLGMNWGLFDTIDVIKYSTKEILHLPTSVLAAVSPPYHIATEQLPVEGVAFPDIQDNKMVSWGVIEGTNTGYIYVWDWLGKPFGQTRDLFGEAVDELMHVNNIDGLILDFRTNTGGYPEYANNGFSHLFNSDPTSNYSLAIRIKGADHSAFTLEPVRNVEKFTPTTELFDHPIAVLTGPMCGSAGDRNAFRLRFHPMARFFGKPTNGAYAAMSNQWYGTLAAEYLSRVMDGSIYSNYNNEGYMIHKPFDVDEDVWLTPDGAANGEDDVVKKALEWINNMVYSHDLTISSSFLSPGADTLKLSAVIENPNSHIVSTEIFIKDLENTLIESIELQESENIWKGNWPAANEEGIFKVDIKVNDQSAGNSLTVENATRFTTVPLLIDSLQVNTFSNNRYSFKPFLKNAGSNFTLENLSVKLTSSDPWIMEIISDWKNCPNILPGQTEGIGGYFLLRYDSAGFPGYFNLTFNISSDNWNYWTIDTAINVIVGVERETQEIPAEFVLSQNYPNPFNPSTKIKYSIPQSTKVTLKVFDVLGREVAVLVNEEKSRGTYEIYWSAENLPSGVYFYQIRAGTFVKTNKMILMK